MGKALELMLDAETVRKPMNDVGFLMSYRGKSPTVMEQALLVLGSA